MLHGLIVEPETKVIKRGSGDLRITAEGDVKSAIWDHGTAALRLKPLTDEKEFHIALGGVNRELVGSQLLAPLNNWE